LILRLTRLLIVIALAVPATAAAQVALPVATATAIPKMAAKVQVPVQPRAAQLRYAPRRIILQPATERFQATRDRNQRFELRAKAEWLDDQGLRVGPTKIAYRQRF